jgi:hypothetical protein
MAVSFLQTIPLPRIFDGTNANEFSVGFLRFVVDRAHRLDDLPASIQVSIGHLAPPATGHHGDGCPGSAVWIWKTD